VEVEGISYETTILELVKKHFKKYENEIITAKLHYQRKVKNPREVGLVNTGPEDEDMENESTNDHSNLKYELYDLTRTLEGDCSIELLDFTDPLGKMVFWHSSAHIMGESLEQCYGGHLCIGPPL